MILMVYSPEMEPLGMIEGFLSISWTRRAREPSECAIEVPYDSVAGALLQVGNLIMKMGDREAMEIVFRTVSRSPDDAVTVAVEGRGLLSWLSRRVNLVDYGESITATPQEIIYRLIRQNATAPAKPERALPILLNERPDFGLAPVEFSGELYSPLDQLVEDQLNTAALNLFITTNPKTKTHVFDVRPAVDKTEESAEPCIFSPDFGTLGEAEYRISSENYKTFAYMTGGDDEIGTVQVGGGEGLNRREVGVSASDIKLTWKDADGNERSQSPREARAALYQRGVEQLSGIYRVEETFEGEIQQSGGLSYPEDYDVGDRVTLVHPAWGVRMDATITEIEENYDETGAMTLTVTFGEGVPSARRALMAALRM